MLVAPSFPSWLAWTAPSWPAALPWRVGFATVVSVGNIPARE